MSQGLEKIGESNVETLLYPKNKEKQNQVIKEGGQILKFSTNPVANTANNSLISVAKVVKEFVNPTISSEKMQKKAKKMDILFSIVKKPLHSRDAVPNVRGGWNERK